MAVDFAKPATSDNYSTQFVPNLLGNFTGLAQMLDSAQTTVTGTVPQYVKRYNRTSSALEEWNGTAWVPIPLQGLTHVAGVGIGAGGTPIAPFQQFGANANSYGALFASALGVGSSGNGANVALVNAGTQSHLRTNWYYAGAVDRAAAAGYSPYFVLNFTTGDVDLYRTTSVAAGAAISPALTQRWQADGKVGFFGGAVTRKIEAQVIPFVASQLDGLRVQAVGAPTYASELLIGTDASGVPYGSLRAPSDGNGYLTIWTAGNERVRVDSTGRVNVGTTVAGVRLLNINDVNPAMTLKSTVISGGAGSSSYYFGNSATDTIGWLNYEHAANYFTVGVNNAERMRITSGGLVLINRTSDSGLGRLQVDGNFDVAPTTGTASIYVRAAAGHTALAEFVSNGNAYGSAGMQYGQDVGGNGYMFNRANATLIFGTNNTTRMSLSATGALTPASDAGQNLGGSATRWATLFASALSDGANATSALVESMSTNVLLAGGSAWTSVVMRPGGTDRLVVLADGRMYGTALHNNANAVTGTTNQYIASGKYTPTPVNNSNATSLAGREHQWMRVGNVCNVSGEISAGATAANTVTTVRIPLPIASTFSSFGQGAGVVWIGGNTPFAAGCVEMDTTNHCALLRYFPTSTGTVAIKYTFQYEIR